MLMLCVLRSKCSHFMLEFLTVDKVSAVTFTIIIGISPHSKLLAGWREVCYYPVCMNKLVTLMSNPSWTTVAALWSVAALLAVVLAVRLANN